jgi:subtilisin family serine protease
VKRIHLNSKVEATLDESVHVIGADSVWQEYGDRGDSVVVGIIDTGIDYLHPALGGGFGPGFKVIGGYDISNHDSDPIRTFVRLLSCGKTRQKLEPVDNR